MRRLRGSGRRFLLLLACVVLALHFTPAAAGTTVSGSIERDTTWRKSDAPFVIHGRVIVGPHATLAIEPGVLVKGARDAALIIKGVLIAEGTLLDPILFTSRSGKRDWTGISFVGSDGLGGEDARSSLSQVVIEKADKALKATYDTPTFENIELRSNRVAMHLVMPSAPMTVTSAYFHGNEKALIGNASTRVEVRYSDFWNNELSVSAGPKRWFDCVPDSGVWDIRFNDILRGPDQPWHSHDFVTPPGSNTSPYTVDATLNHWGTVEAQNARARMPSDGPGRGQHREIQFEPISPAPTTPRQPSGPVGEPAPEPSSHGDPPTSAWIDAPKHGDCISAAASRVLEGRGFRRLTSVKEVHVALSQHSREGCRWLKSKAVEFTAARSCTDPVWLEPEGLANWTLHLKKSLPRGRYTALAWTTPWERRSIGQELGRNRSMFTVT